MVANSRQIKKYILAAVLVLALVGPLLKIHNVSAATKQTGSVGLQGKVSAPPPSQAATINVPTNGQSFSTLPITVSGFCANNTLVEIYKNNVFAGSVECQGGSYHLQIDLFDGRNDLVAKEFDDLNQAGPDSAVVTVNFSTPVPSIGPQLLLTSEFSKRGANPGAILNWPVTLSGGTGPYAISVDWGDKSKLDLISQQIGGLLNLQHTYAQAGIYNVLITATDANGDTAFLQVVGIGNGPIQQAGASTTGIITNQTVKVVWWPIILLFILIVLAFWLGQRRELEAIRRRLRNGEDSFN